MTSESDQGKPTYGRLATCFAPAGRETEGIVERQAESVAAAPLVGDVLDAMPTMVMVLNKCRQIVAANAALLDALGQTVAMVRGRRPGEAVCCCHANKGPDGCGTGPYCVACGAVHAIVESQATDGKVVRECRILTQTPKGVQPLELIVTATPIRIDGERFLVVAADDVSQDHRLAALQRAFFHDVLNTAGCIEGFARYIAAHPSGAEEVVRRLDVLAERLVDEIRGHRDLFLAERGDLIIDPEPARTGPLLAGVLEHWMHHPAAQRRAVVLRRVWDGTIETDARLLSCVLGNMIKNALEATAEGGVVGIDCTDEGDAVVFAVHNAGVMPEEVQLQVFQRSFTTKGDAGRGIGTHSMKLFGERYLGGRVDFVSREGEGTTFRLTLPKQATTQTAEQEREPPKE